MTTPVTVVIVSWNGRHLLGDCLAGLSRQTYPRAALTVVVVDNASTDGTVAYLAERFPWVRVLVAAHNLGFAGGNDLALTRVHDPFVVLLNNDAVPEPDFVGELVAAMERPGWERVGAATARVLLRGQFVREGGGWVPAGAEVPGGVVLVNSTGNVVDRAGYGRDRDWLVVDDGSPAKEEVFGFCGAAAVLRTRTLSVVGAFDDRFFLYYEDTDLSWRMRLAGWEVRHVHAAVVRHEHAASSREGSALFRFHDDRNRLLTLVKNAPASLALAQLLRHPLSAASIRLRADDGMTRTRMRVGLSLLRLLPHAVRARRRFSRSDRSRVAALLEPDHLPGAALRGTR